MAKFEKKPKEGSPEWMATYGDLVTLLLCFFIMLFATAEVDTGKFEILLQAFNPSILELNGTDNILGENSSNETVDMTDYLSEELAYQAELKALASQLNTYFEEEGLINSIEVIRDSDKITLRFNSSILFASGKASLKDDVKPYLKKISTTIPQGFDIQIEGHTDNLPINNSEFKSNWDLSALRGVNVLKYLVDTCNLNPERLSVAGYGEHQPIADNSTEEGRSKNRRVDIILFKKDKTQS